jgi:hypothetical protein
MRFANANQLHRKSGGANSGFPTTPLSSTTIKPRKIIEIGSGHSTKIARIALIKNHSESGQRATHTCIEPYEMGWLEKVDGIQVIRERLETCGLDWAKELSAGDLLFVDSSHMIRPQGDVLNEYLEGRLSLFDRGTGTRLILYWGSLIVGLFGSVGRNYRSAGPGTSR